MNHKKQVLVLNLNEVNLNFILKNAKKYKNKNIIKFFKKKKLLKLLQKIKFNIKI